MKKLTQLEFTQEDSAFARRIAKGLGYTQTAYTSSSELIGLYCLPDNSKHRKGCIIKTEELGFLFIQDLEDLRLPELFAETVCWKHEERKG